jgi:hypothetical protein
MFHSDSPSCFGYSLPSTRLVLRRISLVAASVISSSVGHLKIGMLPLQLYRKKFSLFFPESFYENDFGTVGVKVPRFITKETSGSGDTEKDIIEVTTYRTESGYDDKRRPNTVSFTPSLTEDLARRDFTINAMAYGEDTTGTYKLVDPFDGANDLKKKLLRTVGSPEERFGEDALRLMRAIRLVTELRDPTLDKESHNWHIEEKSLVATYSSLTKHCHVSQERLRDELSKNTPFAKSGFWCRNAPKNWAPPLHSSGTRTWYRYHPKPPPYLYGLGTQPPRTRHLSISKTFSATRCLTP